MAEEATDRLWDEWEDARRQEPGLDLRTFAERTGRDVEEVRLVLALLTELEENSDPPPLVDVGPGDSFAGFELVAVLGRGASGIVFSARGPDGALVALKVLNPLTTFGNVARRTLRREVEVAARLEHPGIVRVLSSGVERGYAWVATEHVEDGRTLSPEVYSALDPIDVGLQIAEALRHAHAAGVVHRDLKPGNLLVDGEGRVRVIDFGLARLEGAAFAISRTGAPIGTPLYMAPEQLRGESGVGPEADLYSLGLILLEVAAGRGLDLTGGVDSLARIATGRYRFPRRVLHRAPSGLRGVIARCLEPDPRDRYADAGELARDLEAVRSGERPARRAPSSWERLGKGIIRRPLRTAGCCAATLLLIWLGLWTWRIWTAVEVRIHYTGPDSVQLFVDGERIDVQSGERVSLQSGDHRFELRLPSFGGDRPVIRGQFVVDRGRPSVVLPGFPDDAQPIDPPEGDEPWGYLVMATLDHGLAPEVFIDDGYVGALTRPVTHFPVPLGGHHLEVRWGSRKWEHHFEQRADRYTAFDVVRPSGDRWHDVVIGSLIDSGIEVLEADNVAPVLWRERPDGAAVVTRTEYRQVDWERGGVLTLCLDLPVPVHRVELLHLSNAEVGGTTPEGMNNPRTQVEAGPTVDDLVLVGHVGRGASGIDDTAWEEVSRRFAGEQTLILRYALPPAASEGEAENALRSALPTTTSSDSTFWDPALVLRVSEEPGPDSYPEEAVSLAVDGPIPEATLPALHLGGARYVVSDSKNGRVCIIEAGVEIESLEVPGIQFGKSLAILDDLDGDETQDLAVGACGATPTSTGSVWILSGKDLTPIDNEPLGGGKPGEMFGNLLAPLGDLNDDGIGDLVVFSRAYWTGSVGRAWVVSVGTREVFREHIGRQYGGAFGIAAWSPGDVDGDGIDDYAVGARDADGPAIDAGAVTIFSGSDGNEIDRLRGSARHFGQLGVELAGEDGHLFALGRNELLEWSLGETRRTHIRDGAVGIFGTGERRFLVGGPKAQAVQRVETTEGIRWLLGGQLVDGRLQPVLVKAH